MDPSRHFPTGEVSLTIRSYKDNDPLVGLCVKAQQYYEEHSIPTRVKACSCITIDEILQLSGVAAHTIPPEDLATLASMNESKDQLDAKSLFKPKKFTNGYGHQQRRTYMDDEAKYRVEFAASDCGKGQFRLYQVSFSSPNMCRFMFTSNDVQKGRCHFLGFPKQGRAEDARF
jgi:hypothetical protein